MKLLKISLSIFVVIFVSEKMFCQKMSNPEVETSLKFSTSKNWRDIQLDAQREHKIIFIDCYATWCGPCKKMEKDIMTMPEIANYLNDKFINVRIQFDTTKNDNIDIKNNYSFAKELEREYKIKSFPTFLFFNSDGKIVHTGVGYMDAPDFLVLVKDAINPNKQIFARVEKYKKDKLHGRELLYLADDVSKVLKDYNLSHEIGNKYLQEYVYKLDSSELYTYDNLYKICLYINNTKEKGFVMMTKEQKVIDSIMGRSIANPTMVSIIEREFILPVFWHNGIPEGTDSMWSEAYLSIKKKFGEAIAYKAITNTKLNWFIKKELWEKAALHYFANLEKEGSDSWYKNRNVINNAIWVFVFEHSFDPYLINKSIDILSVILEKDENPLLMDTYANLLYKKGDSLKAIEVQSKAIQVHKNQAKIRGISLNPVFEANLDKMKQGIPTWNYN